MLYELLDQREEVVPQPRDTLELGTVCQFVEGHPETKLGRVELVGPFELKDVRADEGDQIAALSTGQDEFVLAQDSSREKTQDRRHLGLHHPLGRHGCTLTGDTGFSHPLLQTPPSRFGHMSEGRNISFYPLRSSDDRCGR